MKCVVADCRLAFEKFELKHMKYLNKTFLKFSIGFSVIILGGIFLLAFVANLNGGRVERVNIVAKDNYGGSAPRETLGMFIAAVQIGDRETAVKYFVPQRREKWRAVLSEMKNRGELPSFLLVLKQSLLSKGDYSADKKVFMVHEPVSIVFILSSSGIWKINRL